MRCSLNEKVNIKIGGDLAPPRCIRVAFPGSGGVVSRDGLCLSVLHADCITLCRWSAGRRRRFASACSMRIASKWKDDVECLIPLPQRAPCGLHRDWGSTRKREAIALPQRAPCGLHLLQHYFVPESKVLCLSVLHADCIAATLCAPWGRTPLPQRAPCGLHRLRSGRPRRPRPLPQRAPCGLHHTPQLSNCPGFPFASACSMRIASAKMHE